MTKTNKKSLIPEEATYGVDSRYQSAKEKELDAIALMEARLERIKSLPREQILRAKLLQLKLKMEDYLKEPAFDRQNQFASFLEMYVDIIYSKRSEFARDINVTPVYLSKVINNHRQPKEEFILKLIIHSEKVFKHVAEFQEMIWYQIYFQEKICDTMSNQHQWRPKIEKQVKLTDSLVK